MAPASSKSIWPLQCVVNELPYNFRKKHVLLKSLWLSTSKPVMLTFLKPFMEECQRLETVGFMWMNKMKSCGEYLLVCSCDSTAHCVIQNIKQYMNIMGNMVVLGILCLASSVG